MKDYKAEDKYTWRLPFEGKRVLRAVLVIIVVVFVSNLGALVDAVMHPEIEYFDEEHIIVGGVVGLVTLLLFGALSFYIMKLEKAIREVKSLEGLLPICSHCKKIHNTENNWEEIESYISDKSDVLFSHGICPECYLKLYGKKKAV